MKKILCIALVLALAASVSIAESLDLSGMTMKELIELRSLVDVEIATRSESGAGSPIGDGVYYCGETIKAGTYAITFVAEGDDYPYVKVYDANKKEKFASNPSVGMTIEFTLEDGDKLIINSLSGLVHKIEKYDWMI